jgi:hypothetical protein
MVDEAVVETRLIASLRSIFQVVLECQVVCILMHTNPNQYQDGEVSSYVFHCYDSYIYRALRRVSQNRNYYY